MINIPYDVSFHFDNDLRDVPSNASEMQNAVNFLKSKLDSITGNTKERVQLLGLIGVYSRMLGDYLTACDVLKSAVVLSETMGINKAQIANSIRLAHVYQWQCDYKRSESLFNEVIATCKKDSDLAVYLDFAFQHMGKCKFDQQKYKDALEYFEQALLLRKAGNNQSLIESTQIAINAVNTRLESKGA